MRQKLHRIGDEPIVVTLTLEAGETIELAAGPEHRSDLLGPFAAAAESSLVATPT